MKDKNGQTSAILVFLLIFWIGMIALVHFTNEAILTDYNTYSEFNVTTQDTTVKDFVELFNFNVESTHWVVALFMNFMAALTIVAVILVVRGI